MMVLIALIMKRLSIQISYPKKDTKFAPYKRSCLDT